MTFRHSRHFDRSEAEQLLPRVSELMDRIHSLASKLGPLQARPTASSDPVLERRNGKVHAHSEQEQLAFARELTQLLDELEQMGIVVREPSTGLIDFPSVQDGREVYLCWRLGEPLQIEWWHEIEAGFAGRQRLP